MTSLASMKNVYGHLVIGPPGSGKTTYCRALEQLTRGKRHVKVINLDPAIDVGARSRDVTHDDGHNLQPAVCITELVTLEGVCTETKLGPNGGKIDEH